MGTHGLQALWLQRLLTGELQLPSGGDMEMAVGQDRAWKRSWMPGSSARAAIWQLHMMRCHDGLVEDLGERRKRKGWNLLAEVFAPYSAGDYHNLLRLGAGPKGEGGEVQPTKAAEAEVGAEVTLSEAVTTV